MPTSAERADLRAPLLLAAALGAGLVVQLALPLSPGGALSASAMHGGRSGRETGRLVAFAPPSPIETPSVLLARPLFSPSRAATGSQAAAAKGTITLLGLASTPGRASAVLRGPQGEVRTLRPGEALAGWRLLSVGAAEAVVAHDAERETLTVGAAAVAASPASAVTPGPR